MYRGGMAGVIKSSKTETLLVIIMLVEIMLIIYAAVTRVVFVVDRLAAAAFTSMVVFILIIESLIYDVVSNIERIAETRYAPGLNVMLSIASYCVGGLFLSFLSIYTVLYYSLTSHPGLHAAGLLLLLSSIALLFYGAMKQVRRISIPPYRGSSTHKNGSQELSFALSNMHLDLARFYAIIIGVFIAIAASVIQPVVLILGNVLIVFVYMMVIVGIYSATTVMNNIIEQYIGVANEAPDEKARSLIQLLVEEKTLFPLPILVPTYLSRSYSERLVESLAALLTRISKNYTTILFTDTLSSPLARTLLRGAVEEKSGEPQLYVAVYTKSLPYPRLTKKYRVRGDIVVGVYEHALSISHFVNIIETVRKDTPLVIILDNVNMVHMLLDVPPRYVNTYRFIKTLISRLKGLDILLILYDPGLGLAELTNLLIINSVTVIPFTDLPLVLEKLFHRIDIMLKKKTMRPEIIEDLTKGPSGNEPI